MWLTRKGDLTRDYPGWSLFDDIFGPVIYPSAKEVNTQKITSQSLWETDEAVFVELLVPGVDKKNISVEVVDDILTISYKKGDAEVATLGYSHDEFSYSWQLDDKHEQKGITAKTSNGILTIKVPKVVPPQPESKIVEIQ